MRGVYTVLSLCASLSLLITSSPSHVYAVELRGEINHRQRHQRHNGTSGHHDDDHSSHDHHRGHDHQDHHHHHHGHRSGQEDHHHPDRQDGNEKTTGGGHKHRMNAKHYSLHHRKESHSSTRVSNFETFEDLPIWYSRRGKQLREPEVIRAPEGEKQLNTTLTAAAAVVNIPTENGNISYRTRLYNKQLPGPTIQVSPGDRVGIHLQNHLGANPPDNRCEDLGKTVPYASLHTPNSTNLHVHGYYGPVRQDNTLACVEPDTDLQYDLRIDSRTGNAMYWYHPHMEGSSKFQLYGGMYGGFEIIDPTFKNDFKHHFEVTKVALLAMFSTKNGGEGIVSMASNGGTSDMPLDLVDPNDEKRTFLLVNGDLDPVQNLTAGKIGRFKFVNSISGTGTIQMVQLGFTGTSAAACKLAVTAYDGVFLEEPRIQTSVVIPAGGRAEVIVSCSEGRHVLRTMTTEETEGFSGGFLESDLTAIDLHVSGNGER